ncbi:2-oxo-3-hexenedioate decarboxylase [Rhodobium orientis]|uniref:4-oxalocrotonate decarboxylase n=1 Tax=Rhodobium orientis TaxID=34017 RepID=A0A327JTW5_9HYPH|nr:fumarylacetoacetate hydrolase family protein [Rhodobium orientis]MBB4301284.1 2-oxo-3-hexenedioate decarboxylase [Rhodobium orientis]MBK5951126.1 4-oxalocrotonate decarboxylase [Rhodobium orientis]RAI29960.1 4-oxalocrotonate decarboxylase [Rhodobium orientis]
MKNLAKFAEIVDEAARTATEIPQFVGDDEMTLEEAYAVQAMSVSRRIQRGERRVGFKMGLTSRVKMEQVGVSEVIWGRLTDAMRVEEGGVLDMAGYVHPRVEPEIAYLMKKPLAGDVSPMEALAAVEAVAPALEIIDSRYENFKFALGDVVADNSSSSGFVVGGWHAPDTDVANLGIIMKFDGRPVEIGSTAAILGNPIRSLVAAARMVARSGERLEPGYIVLAGGATAAAHLAPGVHVSCEFQNLGDVEFRVAD